MNSSRRSFLLAALFFSSLNVLNVAIADDAPMVLVKTTSDEVLSAIKENSEKIKADPKVVNALVEKMVLPHIDFQTMSKLVLAVNCARPVQRNKPHLPLSFVSF